MSLTYIYGGPNVSVDGSQGPSFGLTLSGDYTLSNPTNQVAGQVYTFVVSQNYTGGRKLAFGTCYKFAGANALEVSQGSDTVDVFQFVSDGTNMLLVSAEYDLQAEIVAPSSLTATQNLVGEVQLAWTNNDSTADAIRVEIKDMTGMWGQLDVLAATATSYSDPEGAGTYEYRLRALRGTRYSKPSNEVSGTCT